MLHRLFDRALARAGTYAHLQSKVGAHRLPILLARLALLLIIAGGSLWPDLAHANGPSTECPPTQVETVASGGTFTADFSTCSVFGLSGVSVEPTHGSLSGVDPQHGNGTGLVTYVANENPSSTNSITDNFTVLDDEGDTIAFTVTIQPNTSALTISPASLPTPVIGQSYSATLSASGGRAPYTFSVTGLPPGLTFNTNTISGTPTGTGSFVIVVNVTDSTTPVALTGNEDYTVTIAEPVLTAAQPPAAAVNAPYSYQLQISGGTPPYSNYALVAGHGLPAGLSLSSSGLITGTPTAVGTTSFEFTVYDSTSGIAPFFGTVTASLTVNAVPPITLSPSTLGTLTVGVPVNQTITPSGGSGVSPYAFSISAGTLPAGLNLSSTTGVLSGTPTAGGSYSFTISVHDGGSGTGSLAYSGTIQPATIAITPTTLAAGTQATAYSAAITASGGTAPYTYAVSSGALPTGMTLNGSTGALSGTPTVYGNFNFTVTATDSSGGTPYSGSRGYTLTIHPSVPTITPATLPNPVAGVAYSQTLAASGGNPPYAFAISSGSPPPGISLLGDTLSGTPTATGVATFTVQVTDAAGTTATHTYSPNVAAPTITITPATVPAATPHVAYSQTLAAQGGTAPYTFSLASGALPPGLSLGTDGTLSGSPSTGGNFNFTIAATDSTRNGTYQGTRTYSLTVTAPTITLTPGNLPAAAIGTAYSQNIAATGGMAPYTFAVSSGNLPSGLRLSSSGTLSGTPTAGGTVNFTVTATDSNTNTGSSNYSLVVNPPTLNFTPPAGTLNAPYGSAYSQSFAGSGGTAPYTFVLTGTLPNGLSWNPATATLSGTPTQPGNFPVSITMTDSSTGSGPYSKTNNYTVTVTAPSIVLAPATLPSGAVGTAYTTSQLTASGGIAPYTYAIVSGSLPAGLSLSSSGTLSGTPTAAGSFNITARATDANGSSGQQSYTLTIAAANVTLNPATLPVATAEVAYSQSISAAGGTAPYTYSISSGALPAGLSLDPTTGALAGTPTVAGTFVVSVTAHDSSTGTGAPFTASRNYTLTVNAPNVAISPASLPNAKVAAAYTQQFSANGGNGTYSYTVSAGSLPAGLTLSNGGQLSGTPTSAGSFNFSVTATDGAGFTGTQAYTLVVATPTLQLTPASLPAATAEDAYTQTLTASGGTAPYTYAVSAGTLPAGLTLNASSGTLSGTPSAAGSFTFTVKATDSTTGNGAPFSVSQSYTFTVNAPAVTLTPTTLPNAQSAVAYSQQITATGGNGTYNYAVTVGTLPAGLTLSSSGHLAGTPSNVGSFSFTVTATDGLGFTGSQAYALVVGAPTLQLTPTSLPAATAEATYTQSFTASGGTAPYTYAVSAGTLPAGLTLNASNGALSGTPTVAGSFVFSIRATDSSGGVGAPFSISQSYTFTVNAPSLTLTPATLPQGKVAVAYTQTTLSASGGSAPYTYAVTSGSLPAGLTLSPAGVVSGTPTAAGSFNVTVTATDKFNFQGAQAYVVVIGQEVPVVSNGAASTNANTAVTIPVTSEGGPITSAAVTQQPVHGTATVNGLSIVYTPALNYFGTDAFEYTATGSGGTSAPAKETITVVAGAVPVANAQSATVLAGKWVALHATTGATNGPFTAAAIATQPSSGTVVVQGTDLVYTAAADASGSVGFDYTLSNAFGASKPAHVALTIDGVPVAPTLEATTIAGSTVQIDLTTSAHGGPFTAATLVSVSPANAGSATIKASGTGYTLSYTAAPTFGGAAVLRYTLSNAYATSAPGTVTVSVTLRSDPSKNAEVLGVLDAQADATRRMAIGQISNFQRRLEALHGGSAGGGFSNGITASSADSVRRPDVMADLNNGTQNGTTRFLVSPDAPTSTSPLIGPSGSGSTLGGFSIWTGGAVNFGKTQPGTSDNGVDFTTQGLSVGADKQVTERLAMGVGVGYGHDDSDIGQHDSRSTVNSYNGAIYASFRPTEALYADALLGYQWLSFDARRYVTDDSNTVFGNRDGKQWFGSFSVGYEHHTDDGLLFTPYGRLDLAHANLDAYTEHGDATYSLAYQRQTVKTSTGTLGVLAQWSVKSDYGVWAPQLRAEFGHDLQGSSEATMRYADLLSGPLYQATLLNQSRNHTLLGAGIGLQTVQGWTFRAEYQNYLDNTSKDNQSILLGVEKKFDP